MMEKPVRDKYLKLFVSIKKKSLVNPTPGATFRTIHFHCNLQYDPISKCYIVLSWKGSSGTSAQAYLAHS